MASMYLPVFLLVAVALVYIPCEAQIGNFKIFGKISPLIPTDEETEMCSAKAKESDLPLKGVSKMVRKTCQVQCHLEGQTETLMSPKGTLCCDFVGIGPTGQCDGNGKCMTFMN